MRRVPEVAGRVVPGEGGARAADGPRVRVAKKISHGPCYPQGPGNQKHNNKQGVMMMSEDEKKAESATDKLRTLLRKIENIADRALGTQPYDEVPCWEHLSSAVGEIEKELALVSAGGNPPAESAEVAENADPDEKKAIGNFAGTGKVVSYAIDKNLAVTVTARTTDGRTWMFKGIKNGETAIMGTILGGKATAVRYCKFIRNGIVSRLMKIKQNHARRAEKAASALADARSAAGKAVA